MANAAAVMVVVLLGAAIGFSLAGMNHLALYALVIAGCVGMLGLLFGTDEED
jgi:hypothetical protein